MFLSTPSNSSLQCFELEGSQKVHVPPSNSELEGKNLRKKKLVLNFKKNYLFLLFFNRSVQFQLTNPVLTYPLQSSKDYSKLSTPTDWRFCVRHRTLAYFQFKHWRHPQNPPCWGSQPWRLSDLSTVTDSSWGGVCSLEAETPLVEWKLWGPSILFNNSKQNFTANSPPPTDCRRQSLNRTDAKVVSPRGDFLGWGGDSALTGQTPRFGDERKNVSPWGGGSLL